MKSRTILFIIFVACLSITALSGSHNTLAQVASDSLQGINLKLSNEYPTAGEKITVTAESYVANLDSSAITWELNGSLYQKGTGIISIEVQAPAAGKKLIVNITATTPEGRTMNAKTTISAGNLELILEPNGYVPPLFMGKLPLSYQNSFRIIAMPHLTDADGNEYDPKELIYQWSKNSRVVKDQSGYGKQVFTYQDELVPSDKVIDVVVSSPSGGAKAEKIISVSASNPFVYFYKDDPLYGPLYNVAVGSDIDLGGSGEVNIMAIPFGFNKPVDSLGNLVFTWLLNSVEQTSLKSNQSITLRAPDDSNGTSNIQLTVNNTKDILQKADGGFNANFDTRKNQNTEINSNGI